MQLKKSINLLILTVAITISSLSSAVHADTNDNNGTGLYEKHIYDLPLSVLQEANKLIFCTLEADAVSRLSVIDNDMKKLFKDSRIMFLDKAAQLTSDAYIDTAYPIIRKQFLQMIKEFNKSEHSKGTLQMTSDIAKCGELLN
ncbi:MAG: hypothetical protein ACXWT4_17460 [Methylobacter sp.]